MMKPQLLSFNHNNTLYHLDICHIGFEKLPLVPVNKTWPIHTHPVFHFILFTYGQHQFYLGDQYYSFKPGTFVICPPNIPHTFGPFNTKKKLQYKQMTLQFINDKDEELTDGFDAILNSIFGIDAQEPAYVHHIEGIDYDRFNSAYDKIISQYKKREPLPDLYFSITTLFYYIQNQLKQYTDDSTPIKSKSIDTIKNFIDQNFRSQLQMSDLAKEANFSEGHLSRLFQSTYNISPINYLIQKRVAESQKMLKASDMTIKQIASETGFSDIYYFTRMFKKITGNTPSKYRRERIRLS